MSLRPRLTNLLRFRPRSKNEETAQIAYEHNLESCMLYSLPSEVIAHILRYLSPSALLAIRLVCRYLDSHRNLAPFLKMHPASMNFYRGLLKRDDILSRPHFRAQNFVDTFCCLCLATRSRSRFSARQLANEDPRTRVCLDHEVPLKLCPHSSLSLGFLTDHARRMQSLTNSCADISGCWLQLCHEHKCAVSLRWTRKMRKPHKGTLSLDQCWTHTVPPKRRRSQYNTTEFVEELTRLDIPICKHYKLGKRGPESSLSDPQNRIPSENEITTTSYTKHLHFTCSLCTTEFAAMCMFDGAHLVDGKVEIYQPVDVQEPQFYWRRSVGKIKVSKTGQEATGSWKRLARVCKLDARKKKLEYQLACLSRVR